VAGNNQITLEVVAEFKDALKQFSALQKAANSNFKSIQESSQKAFQETSNSAKKSLSNIESGYASLKAVAIAAVGFIAGKALINAFSDAVKAASAEEDAINQLNIALQLTGKYSEESSKQMVEFSNSIEQTTKFSGEAALSASSLIQNLANLSTDGLQEATAAAADLSAAIGIDLQTAAQLVGKAATGQVGALKKFGITIKEGANTAETFSNALKQLQDNFGGAAAAQLNTFSGATTQLGNASEDVSKSLGRLITQSPEVIAAIQILSRVLRSLADSFENSNNPIKKGIASLTLLAVKTIPALLTPLGFLFTATGNTIIIFNKLVSGVLTLHRGISILIGGGLALLPNTLNLIGAGLAKVFKTIATFFGDTRLVTAFDTIIDGAISNLIDINDINKSFDESFNGLGSSLGEFQKGLSKTNDGIDEFNQGFVAAIEDARPSIESAVDGFEGLVNEIKKGPPELKSVRRELDELSNASGLELLKGSFDKVKASVESITQELNKQKLSKSQLITAEQAASAEAIANASKEIALRLIANEISIEEAKSANQLIEKFRILSEEKAKLAQGQLSFGDFRVGELGEAISGAFSISAEKIKTSLSSVTLGDIGSSITSALSTGAEVLQGVLGGGYLEKLSGFITGLANAPQAFVGIIEGLANAIDGIFAALPEVLGKIVDILPGIFSKIADALPALASKLGEVFENLAGTIADAAPKLAEGLLDAITNLVDAVPRIVDKLVSALPKLLSAILKKLPALITAIARAIPQIIRSIAMAIPEIIAVFAENLGPIILALVQGILEAIPEIILTLIDVFIVKGGLFKIIGSILKAIPQIAIALVQGIIRSAVNSTQALFGFIKNIFGGALGGIFSSLKFPSINIDGIKDFLTGKKFVDGIRENFGEIKDVLTGKKFAEGIRDNFGEIKDVLTGKKFAEGVINSLGWTTVKDVLTGKKFAQGVLDNFGKIKGFLTGETFANRVKGVFTDFIEALKGLLSGGLAGGNKGGLVQGLKKGKIPGLATGGQVFNVPSGFSNDTFPAFLSSGELVVDTSTASMLRAFLDQTNSNVTGTTDSNIIARFDSLVARMERSSEKEVSVNIQVGEKDLASVLLNLNRQGFRVA